MARGSDNIVPQLLVLEGTAPSTSSSGTYPGIAAGKQALYIDSADHLLKLVNSSGTVSSIGGGAISQIAETVLGSDTASITFSSIPATYRNLFVTLTARTDQASLPDVIFQLNADTASNYAYGFGYGNHTFPSSGGGSVSATSVHMGFGVVSGATANAASSFAIRFYDYARTTWQKNATWQFFYSDAVNANFYEGLGGGSWASTAAITAIKLFLSAGNLKTGSIATLWGEK